MLAVQPERLAVCTGAFYVGRVTIFLTENRVRESFTLFISALLMRRPTTNEASAHPTPTSEFRISKHKLARARPCARARANSRLPNTEYM